MLKDLDIISEIEKVIGDCKKVWNGLERADENLGDLIKDDTDVNESDSELSDIAGFLVEGREDGEQSNDTYNANPVKHRSMAQEIRKRARKARK